MQGYGTHFYPDGARYEGEWADNMRSGWGTMFYSNGDRYEGEWQVDVRHGYGTIHFGTLCVLLCVIHDSRLRGHSQWRSF